MKTLIFFYYIYFVALFVISHFREFKNTSKMLKGIPDLKNCYLVDEKKRLSLLSHAHIICNRLNMAPVKILVTNNNKVQATAYSVFENTVVFELKALMKFDERVLLSILSHEIYHIQQRHSMKQIILSFLVNSLIFLGLFQLYREQPLPVKVHEDPVISFGIFIAFCFFSGFVFQALIEGLKILVSHIGNFVNRRNEFGADFFALKSVGEIDFLRSMDRLQDETIYIHLTGPLAWLREEFMISHPSWTARKEKAIARLLKRK